MSPEARYQEMLLRRLQRLIDVREARVGDLNDTGLRLLDVSIRATEADCRWAGCGAAARRITWRSVGL